MDQILGPERPRFRRATREVVGQESLFAETPNIDRFPPTRYQGSKLKLLEWLWASIRHLSFSTCLDLFSGTACVSYLFKVHGKQVTANDYLQCNRVVARALVGNEGVVFPATEALKLFEKSPARTYDNHIEATFRDIFFLEEENAWLDVVAQNIADLSAPFEHELALFALYQACLAKRPYNLFHRANLYMRTADVDRNFGNKATWDKPFPDHFMGALSDANHAVFQSGRTHHAVCRDFLEVPGTFDLVYLDPPYLNSKGTGVDYLDFYHFLEGLSDYAAWPSQVTEKYKHKPFRRRANPWNNKDQILGAFSDTIDRYRDSIIVISYRSNGIPSVDELTRILARHGRSGATSNSCDYKYVLSNSTGKEILFLSEP